MPSNGQDVMTPEIDRAEAQGAAQQKAPSYACQVFRVQDIFVHSGVNRGDPVGDADQVCAGDVYQLIPEARPLRLFIRAVAGGAPGTGSVSQVIAEGSDFGAAGDVVQAAARLTLMTPDGDRVELLIVRHGAGGAAADYALPLSPMAPRTDYELIQISTDPGAARLADLVCVSFARGTMVALAGGQQAAVEDLRPGDRLLTRDHGGQSLRWVGQATLRAVGAFAPVVITSGTLGNDGDLIVGQHHRVFLYQRGGRRVAETAELLVQAKHLVDGERVFLREGGFADYFSLVFDRHEIIYAQGIPVESLMVNEATLTHLPDELAGEVRRRFPGLSQSQHFGTEAERLELDRLGAGGFFGKGGPAR